VFSARVPGALQHAVLLRRTGTVQNSELVRSRISGAPRRLRVARTQQMACGALRRIRDTQAPQCLPLKLQPA
jgi:hypothetical protein